MSQRPEQDLGTTALQREDADVQDVRLAVVLNGGVSLAVWISGVVIELDHLVQGSRAPADARTGDVYAELLDVLRVRARIDVIAGTSAGGLNGGFLALGLVRGADLSSMRDLWRDQGELSTLLRDPREKGARSLLRGGHFHEQLVLAYRQVVAARTRRPAPEGEHVDLYLTGTLWDGRRSTFTDDMGRPIVEVDHDATFSFSSDPLVVGTAAAGNLCLDGVAEQLAVASRCTSSFPGAFEPFEVRVGREAAGDRWPSTAGLADFSTTQYVVDGGVLRNKPVKPALAAIYRQSASRQVRRVLAYVVPDPGERAAPATASDRRSGGTEAPGAYEVLLGVLTRLRSTDSVSGELAEIGRQNDEAALRKRTRDRLAQAFVEAGEHEDLARVAFRAYREVRHETSVRTVARLLLAAPAARRWSADEITAQLREIAAEPAGLPFVPGEDLDEARAAAPVDWRWGQSTVHRLGDLTVDVLRRAVWLAPIGSDQRVVVVRSRDEAHTVLAQVRADRADLDTFWRRAGLQLPARSEGSAASPAELAELRSWLRTTLTQWEKTGGRRREALHLQAVRLADCLWSGRAALVSVVGGRAQKVDPRAEQQDRLRALVRMLLEGTGSAEAVLARMLDLEVVQVAFSGAAGDVEQEVELVQISSTTPQLLTGVQEHHFGAFYRASWRCNDWLRGRLDGSEQLVQTLLEPDRLRQLLDPDASPVAATDQLCAALRSVAVGPATAPHHVELAAAWDAEAVVLRAELAVLHDDAPLPRTFPRVAARIADRLHAQLLEQELVALAEAVLGEVDRLEQSEDWARRVLAATADGPVPLSVLTSLARGSEDIGKQRISDEMVDGTDTFVRTTTHAAAAATSMLTALPGPKLLTGTLRAARGYAVLVWVLVSRLTTRSNNGPNLLGLVVGVGAALVALTLVMPGVPIAVTLVGAGLLLAATTASALTQRSQLGWGLGRRTAVACGAVLLAAAVALGWDLARDGVVVRDALLRMAGRVLVVVSVVLLGWFVARARPAPSTRSLPSVPTPRPPGDDAGRRGPGTQAQPDDRTIDLTGGPDRPSAHASRASQR